MMKIVFLDRKTIGEDIDLSAFNEFGEVVIYDYSTVEEAAERTVDADIIILNKVPVNEQTIKNAKNLKLVSVRSDLSLTWTEILINRRERWKSRVLLEEWVAE